MMKILKKLAPWIIYGIVALFVFITLRDNYEEVKHYEIARPWLLVPAVLAFSLQFAANSLIWAKLMQMAKQTVSVWNSVHVYVSSFIIRYIPGNVWAIAARASMNKPFGVPVMTSIWGWVIENVSYLLIGLMLSVLVLVKVDEVPQWVVAIVVVGIPSAFLLLMRYEWVEKLVLIVSEKRFPEKVQKEVEKFELSIQHRFQLIAMFVIPWVLFSIQFYFVSLAVVDVSLSDFILLAGVNALSWCIGYIVIIAPSGAGVKEGVTMVALTALGLTGEVDAVVVAVLARITAVLGEVLYFGIVRGANLLLKRDERAKSKK